MTNRAGAPDRRRASLADDAFRSIVEGSSDLTVAIGADRRILYLSGAAERVWGYDIEAQVGRDFVDFVHPDDLQLVLARFAMAVDMPGVTVAIELRIRRADGSWRHAETRTTNHLAAKSVQAVVVNLRDVQDRIEADQQLKWRAHHDSLTGLYNRAAMLDRLDRRLETAMEETRLAVLYVDLDGFKAVNDRFGHETGDLLLSVIGERLRDTVRAEDVAARIGGDEFVVLVDTQATSEAVLSLADRIIQAVSQSVETELPGAMPSVSASIGIAFADQLTDGDRGEQAAALLADADRALYEAKARGQGQVAVFRDAP